MTIDWTKTLEALASAELALRKADVAWIACRELDCRSTYGQVRPCAHALTEVRYRIGLVRACIEDEIPTSALFP
jgi:uncharacterized protein YecT (DUF1311 family)